MDRRLGEPEEQPFYGIALESELVILAEALGALQQPLADGGRDVGGFAGQETIAST